MDLSPGFGHDNGLPDDTARRRWLRQAATAGALLALAPRLRAQGLGTYSVHVVPQFPAADIHRTWSPLLNRLGSLVGANFELKVARDIPSFEQALREGLPDFAYLNPFHQLRAHRGHGYRPLVRDSTLLTGILVVRKDASTTTLQQLQGQTLAFPAPNAFGASLLTRAHLDEVARVKFTPLYARTHTNAYRQTLAGQTAATGGLRATLEREPEAVQAQLRILFETPGAAPHPFSAHPRVPAALQEAVQQALLQLASAPALEASYRDIPMARPLRADQQRDYQPLARLKLDRYAE